MADIFDRVAGGGDIFDQIAPSTMPVKFEGAAGTQPKRFDDLMGGSEAAIRRPPGFFSSLIEGATAPFQATPETEAGVAPPVGERINRALQFFTAPYTAIERGTTRLAGENLPIDPRAAEAIGQGAGALASMIPVGRVARATRQALTPARTIDDLIGAGRPALPPPAAPQQLALPSARQPQLPPPANMVMEAGTEGITQAPRRTIIDLVDEVKKDVKAQVIDELFDELKTGRTAAMPRREAPAQIAPPRQMGQLTPRESNIPAIELPPPAQPKVVMGESGVRGMIEEAAPMRRPGPSVAELIEQARAKAEADIAKMNLGKKKIQPLRDIELPSKRVLPEEPPFDIPPEQAGPGGIKGILQSERGQIGSTETNPIVTGPRLATGGMFEESSKTISKTMGPEGTELARLAKAVRNDTEIEAGRATQSVGETLKGLNPKQLDNLVDVLEGKAKPSDSAVQQAFSVARRELDKVAARAQKVGLKIRNPVTGEKFDFQPRENYFPHMFGKELGEVVKDPKSKAIIKDQLKTQMSRAGQEMSDAAVEKALQAMIKATRGRYGHLEIARIFDLGDYSRDPKVVLNKHFTDAYRRINQAQKFGPDLEKGEELLTAIGANRGDKAESFARSYFQKVTHTEPGENKALHDAVTFATNFQAFSKLGQAVISNISQPSYTAVVTGAKNAAKGYRKAFTKEGKAFAERTGGILNDTMTDFLKDAGGRGDTSAMGKAADVVLKGTGFTYVERLNRIMSANSGRYFARELFEKLQAQPANASARRHLAKLNINVDEALKRGSLSELDELRAGQSIINRTQFKTDVTEIPLFWSSEAGRLLTQFKKFQFKAGQAVKDEIIKEMTKGNVMPFLRAAAIFPIAGMATLKGRDLIRWGQQREHQETVADYLAAVGTFGAFTDAFAGSGRQPVRGLSYLAGPTLGDAGALWEAGTAITREGNPLPMAKFAVRQVPVVGPSLRNLFNTPKTETSERDKLMKELGLDKLPSRKRTLKDLGITE